jgi:hypothetical protein
MSEAALRWHLSANHYPPIPERYMPVAQAAIAEVNAGYGNATIMLPDGDWYHPGTEPPQDWMTAAQIVDWLRLADFIDEQP